MAWSPDKTREVARKRSLPTLISRGSSWTEPAIKSRTLAPCICAGGQSRGHDLVSAGKCHLAGGDLADFSRQPIVDLVANHQESEQSAFGAGCRGRWAARKPGKDDARRTTSGWDRPRHERLLEIFLRGLAGEAGSLRVQRDHFAVAIDQHEKITARMLPNILRSVLNGDRDRCWS